MCILYPGDTVEVTTDEGGLPLVITIPDPLVAHADSLTSEVWGQIGGWDNREVEVHNWWGQSMITTTTDSSGSFLVSLLGMTRYGRGHVRFVDQIDNTSYLPSHVS